jgi:hypothetical protein
MALKIVDYRKPLSLFSEIIIDTDKKSMTVKEAIDNNFDIMERLIHIPIGRKPLIILNADALCYFVRKRNQKLYKESGEVFTKERLWKVFEKDLSKYEIS